MAAHKHKTTRITVNGETYTGSGVIFLENYYNHDKKNPRTELAVILFKEARGKNKDKYADAGGALEPLDTLEAAAARECQEESCNLFRPGPQDLDWADSLRHTEYRGFFKGVQGPIYSKWYYQNRKLLAQQGAPGPWLETKRMVRVYVSDLIRDNIMNERGDFSTVSAKGKGITILARTKALIREAIRSNLIFQVKLEKPNVNKNFKGHDPRRAFRNGTKCYYF